MARSRASGIPWPGGGEFTKKFHSKVCSFQLPKVSSFKLLLTDVPAGLPCVARASQARGGQPRGWIAAISGMAAAGVGRGGWLPHRRRVWDRSRFGDFGLVRKGTRGRRWLDPLEGSASRTR